MSEFSNEKIKARHEACDKDKFEAFKNWAVVLNAHIDRGILLRRLERQEKVIAELKEDAADAAVIAELKEHPPKMISDAEAEKLLKKWEQP